MPTRTSALLCCSFLVGLGVMACGGAVDRVTQTNDPQPTSTSAVPPSHEREPRAPTPTPVTEPPSPPAIECESLASAKPSGSFKPVGSQQWVDQFKEFIEVTVGERTYEAPQAGGTTRYARTLDIHFSNEPSGVYAKAGAMKDDSQFFGYTLHSSSDTAMPPAYTIGEYAYEGGYGGSNHCTHGGSATFQESGVLRITKISATTIEGSIERAGDKVMFVAPFTSYASSTPNPNPSSKMVCCK